MEPNVTHMRGEVCLITGATSGIGLVTARELARRGAHVLLVGRNPATMDGGVAQIQAETGNCEVHGFLADFSSQLQVRELAQQVRERYSRLDVLVNNAGGMWLQRELTVDGIEMTVAIN